MTLRCPFVDRLCIESECVGWRADHCFVDDVVPWARAAPNDRLPSSPESVPAGATLAVDVAPGRGAQTRRRDEGNIVVAIDLGTAFSKVAFRIEQNPANPVDFAPAGAAPSLTVLSDVAFAGGLLGLATRMPSGVIVQDVKTAFRRSPSGFLYRDGADVAVTAREGMIYLYTVLIRRALQEIEPLGPRALWITTPSFVFVGDPEFKEQYLKVVKAAYALACEVSTTGWDDPLPVETLRAAKREEACPEIVLVSEPTAAMTDIIYRNPEEVFSVVDIGAGTSDIAFAARFEGHDCILAQDSILHGGRLLQAAFDRVVRDRSGSVPPTTDELHALLRDEQVSIGEHLITAQDVLDQPEVAGWLESLTRRMAALRTQARDRRLISDALFTESSPRNVYVSGGVGRSPAIRRRILPNRPSAPSPLPLPSDLGSWARDIPEVSDLFLQLAPSIGAVARHARGMGEPLAPLATGPPRAMEDYDELRGGLR